MVKIYELTTNAKDGYRKHWVAGVRNDKEARALARRVFGRKYYWASGISYYDDVEKAPTRRYYRGKYWMTKKQFLKLKSYFNK